MNDEDIMIKDLMFSGLQEDIDDDEDLELDEDCEHDGCEPENLL